MADKTAKIELDAASVAKIESTLRSAIGGSSAANIGTVPPAVPTTAAVSLDPETVGRFTQFLQEALVNAAAANIANNNVPKPPSDTKG